MLKSAFSEPRELVSAERVKCVPFTSSEWPSPVCGKAFTPRISAHAQNPNAVLVAL